MPKGYEFERAGHPCIMRLVNQSHYTGYVRTPLPAAWGETAAPVALSETLGVHGGVTYVDEGWVGFDTAHAGDLNLDAHADPLPNAMPTHTDNPTRWTPQKVLTEIEWLAHKINHVEDETAPE